MAFWPCSCSGAPLGPNGSWLASRLLSRFLVALDDENIEPARACRITLLELGNFERDPVFRCSRVGSCVRLQAASRGVEAVQLAVNDKISTASVGSFVGEFAGKLKRDATTTKDYYVSYLKRNRISRIICMAWARYVFCRESCAGGGNV